jgi:hypothetical protein
MQRCVDGIYAIVPHHCGDHTHCSLNNCLFKQIKRRLESRKQATDEDWTMEDVIAIYAEESRFKGRTMSIGEAGCTKLVNEFKKRVKLSNVAHLACVLSSNCCEYYFSCLVKYSQGKRVNYGQTDTWKVIQDFVAGLKSSPNFTTEVMHALGGVDSKGREDLLQ